MDGMDKYADNHFDLCICDPPYGINRDSDGTILIKNKKWEKARITNDIKSKKWDNEPPDDKYFNELFRVSKNQIIWGGNYFGKLAPTNSWVIWDKKITNEMFSPFEMAWSNKGRPKIFRFMYEGFKREKGQYGEKRIHPTQKPVELYRWLLKNYAKKGDLILDTHVGSASSLIACEEMGFKYVGYELDKDYFDTATKRLKNHSDQVRMI